MISIHSIVTFFSDSNFICWQVLLLFYTFFFFLMVSLYQHCVNFLMLTHLPVRCVFAEAVCRRFLWGGAASTFSDFIIQRVSTICYFRLLPANMAQLVTPCVPTASLMQARPRRSFVTRSAHLNFHTCIVNKRYSFVLWVSPLLSGRIFYKTFVDMILQNPLAIPYNSSLHFEDCELHLSPCIAEPEFVGFIFLY